MHYRWFVRRPAYQSGCCDGFYACLRGCRNSPWLIILVARQQEELWLTDPKAVWGFPQS